MDKLSSHRGPKVRADIEAAGEGPRFLPPSGPELNPIESGFAKFKDLLRKASKRTVA